MRAGRMNYTINLPEVNAFTLGQLMFMMELQTAYAGALLNINTFNQPGVVERTFDIKLNLRMLVSYAQAFHGRCACVYNVGGRFSELCPVGLLPAAVLGIDIKGLLAGAAYMDSLCTAPSFRW